MAPATTPTGFFEVCKEADGPGVSGTFTFTVTGLAAPVTAPVGGCAGLFELPVGPVTITEQPVAGTALSGVRTVPQDRLVSTSLPTRSATVNIVEGDSSTQTIAFFRNRSTATVPPGSIEVCKEAGPGVTGSFDFTIDGVPGTLTVPVGGCSGPVVVPAGTAVVREAADPDFAVTGIRTVPDGRLIAADIPGGVGAVAIFTGEQTTVFFNNEVRVPGPPATPGFLQICKEGDASVTGSFDFTVDNTPIAVSVPVGGCSTPVQLDASTVVVREVLQPAFPLTGVRTEPAFRLVNVDLANGAAAATVGGGQVTKVIFRNSLPRGQLKICKIAGAGVPVGTIFKFAFNGNFLDVPAGPPDQGGFCTPSGTFPVGTRLTVVETLPAGVEATAITINPGSRIDGSPNLATGTVSLIVGPDVTEVTYTNRIIGATTTTTRAPTTTTTAATTTTTRAPTTTTTRAPTTTTTTPDVRGCTFTQGYYKNHEEVVVRLLAANGGKLNVGGTDLTAAQVDTLFGTPGKGNYLLPLVHQLMAAKLNQLGGASTPTSVADAIAAADKLVAQQGGPLTGTARPETTVTSGGRTYTASQLNDILAGYNEGKSSGGPKHCG